MNSTAEHRTHCAGLDPPCPALANYSIGAPPAGYDLNGEPGAVVGSVNDRPPLRRLYHWEAYRVGSLTALCVTPGGGLWTGSSRGTIRVWELPPRRGAAGGRRPLLEGGRGRPALDVSWSGCGWCAFGRAGNQPCM